MKNMTANEIREAFLNFFAEKCGHLRLASAPLIPQDDPTLLLIGAGMAPFKPFFTGKLEPPRHRIATSQRCVRTGDIENVGRTARHQTFFEMLGNFSFGDYFKKEAIEWAWDFLTNHLELPKDKLHVTIYPKDDEAREIWLRQPGLNPAHISKLEDNFWEIGPGPCGPDSEIYIDLGEERGCGSPDCAPGCDCDRFLEIWNLVFTQFDKQENGEYLELAKKNIDTGAGLERLASVLQGKRTNFETDLLYPIIEYCEKISGKKYGADAEDDVAMKVIADHLRSAVVMIGDGIMPSNEGRGYVLRRIMRRAARFGRKLGIADGFLAKGVATAIAIYKDAPDFADIVKRGDYIEKVIGIEEERFSAALAQGMEILDGFVAECRANGLKELPGDKAFKLYDTFGFPEDLTAEILADNGLGLDADGFAREMEKQQERARAAREKNARIDLPDLTGIDLSGITVDYAVQNAKIKAMFAHGSLVDSLPDGIEAGVILDVTPFYATGGGQVGDCGRLVGEFGVGIVSDAKKLADGTVYLETVVSEGTLRVGDAVDIEIDLEKKAASARNHTATHLLQAALQRVVGSDVHQAGSLVTPERLRFDFSSFAPLDAESLEKVEALVNAEILSSKALVIEEMPIAEARKLGAMALFGEKYGDIVRVVTVPEFSVELCGGSHVENVGQIGLFKIVSESAVAAGVRRIEAVTGKAAFDYMKEKAATVHNIAALLKVRDDEAVDKVQALLAEKKRLEQEIAKIKTEREKIDAQKLVMGMNKFGDIAVAMGRVNAESPDEMRQMADKVIDGMKGGFALLVAVQDDKVMLVAKAAADAVKAGLHAGKLVKIAAQAVGGNGGGKPDMAQAGGKDAAKLPEAFEKVSAEIKNIIGA